MDPKVPKLGHHFELCFSVKSIAETIEFYERLGFKIYSGGVGKGWCTITDGIVYLALFEDNYIEKDFGVKFLFNYRGGNIRKIIKALEEQGVELYKVKQNEDGTGNGTFKDNNGNVIFVDTAPDEERVDVE